jgi:hypothetical protein
MYNDFLEIMSDKKSRVQYLRHDFPAFYSWHFPYELTSFQNEWAEAMQSKDNIGIIAFRDSAKTTLTKAFVLWCICYNVEDYIIVQSYNAQDSAQWVS